MSAGAPAITTAPGLRRKVYIATGLSQEDLQTQFGAVLGRYAQAESTRDAEFIIFDLDHPPKPFAPFVQDRRGVSGEAIRPEALVPCLIRCTGATTPATQWIRDEIQSAFNSLRLYQSDDELLRELQWIESMIPYVKRNVTREQQDLALAIALRFAG
jgi:hypothetical protein